LLPSLTEGAISNLLILSSVSSGLERVGTEVEQGGMVMMDKAEVAAMYVAMKNRQALEWRGVRPTYFKLFYGLRRRRYRARRNRNGLLSVNILRLFP